MCAYGATHDGEMYDTLAFRNEEFPDTRWDFIKVYICLYNLINFLFYFIRIREQLDGAHTVAMYRKTPFKVYIFTPVK